MSCHFLSQAVDLSVVCGLYLQNVVFDVDQNADDAVVLIFYLL